MAKLSRSGSKSVNLSWNGSVDDRALAGYRIYRNGVLLDLRSVTFYTDYALPSGSSQLSYVVTAVDMAGNESALSNKATVTLNGKRN